MDKRTAIQALCEIVSGVGSIHFDNKLEHDCFCELFTQTHEPIIHKEVIEFIREAVQEKMERASLIGSIVQNNTTGE